MREISMKHIHWHNLDQRSVLLILVLTVTLVYSSLYIFQGWIPHDEGLLSQMAERVLRGEIPHRDFDEPYSGGLTWLNALSFLIWGIKLSSLRITLFLFHLGAIAALFLIFIRLVRPWLAGLLTLTCLVWGVPNYFAGLPSWYNSFFAIFGTLFLIKHIETNRLRWLFMAGLMAGLSFTVKIAGIYFFFAGVLFLFYREFILDSSNPQPGHRKSLPLLPMLITLFLTIFLISIVWRRIGFETILHFILPGALMGVLWIVLEWRGHVDSLSLRRLGQIVRIETPFVFGFLIPVVIFFAFFTAHGALGAVLSGLFVLPQKRYEYAFMALPSAWTLFVILPFIALFGLSVLSGHFGSRWIRIVIGGALLVTLAYAGSDPIYRYVWWSLRPMVPLLVIGGVFGFLHPKLSIRMQAHQQQMLFLMLSVLAFVTVVQFPYSFGIYFCYVSMFVFLAAVTIVQALSIRFKDVFIMVLVFYFLFAIFWINSTNVRTIGVRHMPAINDALILPDRADLLVPENSKVIYETLVKTIHEHSQDSDYIFAGPDAPEVYFLSKKRNPTRIFYEFFVPEHASTQSLIEAIDRYKVRVVVLNRIPEFSRPIQPEFYRAITQRFTHFMDIAHFRVLW
jgi:hypothetical protein